MGVRDTHEVMSHLRCHLTGLTEQSAVSVRLTRASPAVPASEERNHRMLPRHEGAIDSDQPPAGAKLATGNFGKLPRCFVIEVMEQTDANDVEPRIRLAFASRPPAMNGA